MPAESQVKHQPARLLEKVSTSRCLFFEEMSGRTLTYEQHEEVARRTNAYPNLVETLRAFVSRMDPNGAWVETSADRRALTFGTARALLRELGEL
jgi:hypothetical protein